MFFFKNWQVTYGSTRIVLLTTNYAFKIPRFSIFWVFRKFFAYQTKTITDKRQKEFLSNNSILRLIVYALSRALWEGLLSNWREYKRWKSDPTPKRTPVIFSVPAVLVVMPRRKPHPKDIRPTSRIFAGNHDKELKDGSRFDVKPANMVVGPNAQVEFCDYGGTIDPVYVYIPAD